MNEVNVISGLKSLPSLLWLLLALFGLAAPSAGWGQSQADGLQYLGHIMNDLPEDARNHAMFFDHRNPESARLIESIFVCRGVTPLRSYGGLNRAKEGDITFHLVQKHEAAGGPGRIEFRKIDPTRYRLRLFHLHGSFPLVFNEANHSGWKLFLVPWGGEPSSSLQEVPAENDRWQQNVQLPEVGLMETMGAATVRLGHMVPSASCPPKALSQATLSSASSPIVQWPELLHWDANGFANAWWLDLPLMQQLFEQQSARYLSPDGAGGYNLEVILQFTPQVGMNLLGMLALAVLGSCLLYLFFWGVRRALRPT